MALTVQQGVQSPQVHLTEEVTRIPGTSGRARFK
jgi:hypothetical protein